MMLEVLFSPPEYAGLQQRDLKDTVCVVFDILRATTSMVTALNNGASGIVPVLEIADAVALRQANPEWLLAGERNGLRIKAAQTGSIDFDLGNSPREFVSETVRGKTIVMTTTNGTRAMQACRGANRIFIGSFLNLNPLTRWIEEHRPPNLVLVCSGTHERAALEDTLAAGALCEKIRSHFMDGFVADSAEMARQVFLGMESNLEDALHQSENGRRLAENPMLAADIPICAQRETLDLIAECKQGVVQIH